MTTGTCEAPVEVAHSLRTEVVRHLQLCNNPGTAGRKRHARCHPYLAMGSPGAARRHDLDGFAPGEATASCRFPGAGIAPVSRRPRNAISAIGALRGTAGFRCSANRVLAVSAEPVGGRTPAIYAWKNLRVPSARALPEAIARTVCQYTGVSWSPGVAGRLPAANPLSAVVTRRSGRPSCWLGGAAAAAATLYRRGSSSRGTPGHYAPGPVTSRRLPRRRVGPAVRAAVRPARPGPACR